MTGAEHTGVADSARRTRRCFLHQRLRADERVRLCRSLLCFQ